jgi:hypothetical protein
MPATGPLLTPHPMPRLQRRSCLRQMGLLALAPLWLPATAWAQTTSSAAPVARPAPKPDAAGYTELNWEDLVPKGWDPMKSLRDQGITNPAALNDADPKVMDMMRSLRQAWDNAPTETTLNGHRIKLPGYVVPLEEDKAGLTEFLLVPYFGACIHSPPPPANQIVQVLPAKPAAGFRAMDTVWVRGVLRAQRSDSPMGASGYRLESALVERYQAPPASTPR